MISMAQFVKLVPENLKALREVNPRLMSYNVEFAEVTGGTFWKAYTPEQVAGTEEFHVAPSADGIAAMYKDLMQVYAPIDLYNEKLRSLAKELGTAWVRVSGTWATKTYYDFDNTTGGTAPEGYLNVLTKEQWIGVLDFVKAIDAKLMISVANCPGLHSAEEPWNPSEAEKIFRLSKEYGVPIDGAEFANEPNMMEDTGFPAGYTPSDYRRDQDLFFAWVRANYPECICIGPSSVGEGLSFNSGDNTSGGIEQLVRENCSTAELLEGTKEPLDVFSYHYYNGVSERLASVMPTNLYGPNDNFDLERSHVLPAMIRKIHLAHCLKEGDWEAVRKDMNQRPVEGVNGDSPKADILNILRKYGISETEVTLWGTGTPLREFLWSEEMADASVFVMEHVDFKDTYKEGDKDIRNCHINIGTGKEITIRQLAEQIVETVGYQGKLTFDSSKPDGTMRKLTDPSKLHSLGWHHKIEIEEGVRRMYEWYLK